MLNPALQELPLFPQAAFPHSLGIAQDVSG